MPDSSPPSSAVAEASGDHLPLDRIQNGLTGVDCTCGWLSFDYLSATEAWSVFQMHRRSYGLARWMAASDSAPSAPAEP